MYQLYGMPRSRSTRVTWTLEEIGADYRFQLVDLMKGEGQSAEFLQINPYGKLPVLIDGELVLTESAAICTYLGDKHPESGLVPRAGTPQRGQHDQWCFFAMAELEQPLWSIHKHRFVFPEEKRIPQMLVVAPWEFARASKVLVKGLGGREYLVGGTFSLADLLVTHTLLWAKALKMPLDSPELDDYIERISSRPAFERARQREKSGK